DPRKEFSVQFAEHPTVQEWFITKYRDTSDAAGVNGFGGNDHIMMRYADVILLLAEVNFRLGNETEAIQMLNQVRERAGLPLYEEAMQDPAYASKFPTLQLAILHERRVELAFEQKRWYDLLRAFSPQELVNYFGGKKRSEYGIANLDNISEKDRYFPIPFDEYKLDPEKMYQNPGYNQATKTSIRGSPLVYSYTLQYIYFYLSNQFFLHDFCHPVSQNLYSPKRRQS